MSNRPFFSNIEQLGKAVFIYLIISFSFSFSLLFWGSSLQCIYIYTYTYTYLETVPLITFHISSHQRRKIKRQVNQSKNRLLQAGFKNRKDLFQLLSRYVSNVLFTYFVSVFFLQNVERFLCKLVRYESFKFLGVGQFFRGYNHFLIGKGE